MITGQFAIIRSAEADDAPALKAIYDPVFPRSCLMDPRYEMFMPTLDELREAMGQKEMGKSMFMAVEDLSGNIRGFCALRGLNPEIGYSELVMMFADNADFATPLAEETMEYLSREAFDRLKLNKLMTHALDTEPDYRAFLARHGFVSDGIQRDAVFAHGRYHDLECLTLFRAAARYNADSHSLKENACR